MSLAEILEELPAFTVAERQLLVLRAIELDDQGLSQEDEELIASRIENHRRDPSSVISFDDMKASLRSEFGK